MSFTNEFTKEYFKKSDPFKDLDFDLMVAIQVGNLKTVKYLIENGSNISYYNLLIADRLNKLEILKYFRRVLGDKIPCHECLVRPACLKLCF